MSRYGRTAYLRLCRKQIKIKEKLGHIRSLKAVNCIINNAITRIKKEKTK